MPGVIAEGVVPAIRIEKIILDVEEIKPAPLEILKVAKQPGENKAKPKRAKSKAKAKVKKSSIRRSVAKIDYLKIRLQVEDNSAFLINNH